MKYRFSAVFVFAILFAPLFSEAQDIARPEIYIEENTYDAGDVMEGTVIEHTFTVHNRGGEILDIRKISPG